MINNINFPKKLLLVPFVGIFCILLGLVSNSQVLATPRIDLSPNPFTLDIGSSQVVSVTLQEPIICEDPYIPCNAGLIFTSSDPDNTTINPSSLSFSPNTWYVPQDITVTSLNNGQLGDESITITSAAESASEYYSGFQVSLGATVNNTNVAPAPVVSDSSSSYTTASEVEPLAPDTGYGQPHNSQLPYTLALISLVFISGGLRGLSKNKKTN